MIGVPAVLDKGYTKPQYGRHSLASFSVSVFLVIETQLVIIVGPPDFQVGIMVFDLCVTGGRMLFEVARDHGFMTALVYIPGMRITLIPVAFPSPIFWHLGYSRLL